MGGPYFKFETDPLKHHIRTNLWLPLCKERLLSIRQNSKKRRLRYFTFCAAGAVDVLMLNVHKVLPTSSQDKFDTVTFFDKNPDAVTETTKNIPGASGFSENFTKLVLLLNQTELDALELKSPLDSPELAPDTLETERRQIQSGQLIQFISRFPFDVINLDLEELIFKKKQDPPGDVINALRRIFEWQKKSIDGDGALNEFTLFFTTQIGPKNLSQEYIDSLITNLETNVNKNDELKNAFQNRVGHSDPQKLFNDDFDSFYRIAVPKILLQVLNEKDWHVELKRGINIFEFERPATSNTYRILHLGMHIVRLQPPQEKRMPGAFPQNHETDYIALVKKIFLDQPIFISEATINSDVINEDLTKILARRKKYAGE